jgi:hypothetical protein
MICTICNEYEMVPIWYGTPSIDEVMLAREDKIVLGGPHEKAMTHFCHYCQQTFPILED